MAQASVRSPRLGEENFVASGRKRLGGAIVLLAAGLTCVHLCAAQTHPAKFETAGIVAPADEGVRDPMEVGINLFGPQSYNRERVFANLIAQSEWFVSEGAGWRPAAVSQLDARGWVRALAPGQIATRPFFIPPIAGELLVRCTFDGRGMLSSGGVAALIRKGDGSADFRISATGVADAGGWLQLDQTDPEDPVRNIDCREPSSPADRVFDPAFVASLRGYAALRFLDWQQVNENPASRWSTRSLPEDSSQVTRKGVAIEHMVHLANEAGADPWFIMPYAADADYISRFAQYVRDNLDRDRRVYVELGNEIWNDMFSAARQARDEGVASGLGNGDPVRAQMQRYAQKSRAALKIWTDVFVEEPERLVRVLSAPNAFPDATEMILSFEDTTKWADALAVAPYIHIDIGGRGGSSRDLDWVFGQMNSAISETLGFAERNRRIATRHGKRFVSYEAGQHLVTPNLDFARKIQRDPRMEQAYLTYLEQWRTRFGDRIMLYASTAPISVHGSWGLREYGGQSLAEAPKARAVEHFLGRP